jgi:cytochrome P450
MALNPIKGFKKYLDEFGETFILDAGGSRRSIFTTNPDLIQYVLQKNHRNYEKSEIQTDQLGKYIGYGLLTNSGSHWLRQRRLIQPGFHRKRMESLVTEMQRTIEQHCTDLNANIESGEPIEIQKFTLQLTFRVIARAIFTDGFTYDQMEELDDAMADIQSYVVYPIRLPFLRPVVKALGYEKKYVDLSEAIGDQMLERVNERRNGGQSKDDLLQMLIDSRYEDDGEPMADRQLIDEIMILFAAGHETSANALAWTIYLLGEHPDVKEKIRQEMTEQLASDEVPSMEKLRDLPYLTAVLEESMRLYPPAWISDRVALEDDEFEGIKIPKGMVVVPYFFGLHRHPDLYDDPLAFKPERMLAEEKKKRHSYSFLPFGGGPRMCVGFHFAMLEMQLAMIYLLRNYEFTCVGGQGPEPKPYLTLRPDRKIMMRVEKV